MGIPGDRLHCRIEFSGRDGRRQTERRSLNRLESVKAATFLRHSARGARSTLLSSGPVDDLQRGGVGVSKRELLQPACVFDCILEYCLESP